MSIAELHIQHMKRAIDIAAKTMGGENPTPFAAVVFGPDEAAHGSSHDKLHFVEVAHATESALHEKDPLSQDILKVVHAAVAKRASGSLQGCTIYTTAEPSVLGVAAAMTAEADGVVFGVAADVVDKVYWPQVSTLRAEEVGKTATLRQFSVVGGVLAEEAEALLATARDARVAAELPLPPNREAHKAQDTAKALAGALESPVAPYDPSTDGPFVECM